MQSSAYAGIVLLLFLANLRMSLITLMALPTSFLATALIFKLFGLTVNTMTLGGLAIAIGELVDDSIVDVENIYRRLKENAKSLSPKSRLQVIYEASSEIRNSIVLATIIIALVFFPLFNLTGLEGRLFSPLGVAYLTALGCSLLVSLTLTPVLCSYFLKGHIQEHQDTKLVKKLKNLDQKILRWAMPKSNIILLLSVVITASSLLLIPFMGRDFLPKFNEGTAMVSIVALPGTSLTASNEIGAKAESIMLSIAEVKSVSRRTGRAELDEHAAGVNISEIDIDFNTNGRNREDVLNDIRQQLKREIPNVGVNIGQPISHLIDHMLSGVSAALAIKIFGPDLNTLREKSFEIKEAIQETPGLVDLRIEQQGLIPQIKIQVLREEAAKYFLSTGEVTKLLEGALNGETVTQIIENGKLYDLFYQFDEKSRQSIEKMESTVIKVMPNGQKIFLKDIADIYETTGPNEINRENGQRRMVLSANISDRDLGSLVNEIQSKIKSKIKLPEGYFVVYGGQFENQQAATKKIIFYGALSLIAIAFVLLAHFKSISIVAQIMSTIPLAFIGGLILLFFTERSITVASLVGFITLCGVASRNSIMMITHYLHLIKNEGYEFNLETIIKGSQERLIPVLMTASVASLALFPLLFAKGQPGSEILHPVAIVIVGGLITSTLLDIVVTPVLFYRYGKKSTEKYLSSKQTSEKI